MNSRAIRHDILAASIGALITLPQAVAYGLIAVSPLGTEWAVFGITASIGSAILFGFLSGLFGSNASLISGPRAVTALVLAAAIQTSLDRSHEPSDALFIAFLGLVLAGIFQVASGFLRFGQVLSYIPSPVLSGFVNGSSILVILSALPMVLGAPESSMLEIFSNFPEGIHQWALLVSCLTIAVCLLLEGRFKLIPPALLGLLVGTGVYYFGIHQLQLLEAPLIGPIEIDHLLHLPLLLDTDNDWSLIKENFDIIFLTSMSIGLLASFDTVVTSNALNLGSKRETKANFDLKLHGLLNIVMGGMAYLPGSGTLSRSKAVTSSGGVTRLSNVGVAIIFAIALIALAPAIAALPLWATAGMLVATSWLAVETSVFKKAWRLVRGRMTYPRVVAGDIIITLLVVVTALVFDLIIATGLGILLSLFIFVFGIGRNPIRRVFISPIAKADIERSPLQSKCLEEHAGKIGVIQLQGALFFATSSQFMSKARQLLDDGVEYLVIDFRHVGSIDSTGSETLNRLHHICKDSGKQLLISYVEKEQRAKPRTDNAPQETTSEDRRKKSTRPRWIWLNMEASGLVSTIGRQWFFDDTSDAIEECENQILKSFCTPKINWARSVINESPLFTGLDSNQLAILSGYVRCRRYKPNEVIYKQGEQGRSACFMVRGRVDILIDIPGTNRKKRVNAYTEGTLFGEVSLIDGGQRSATIITTKPTICFVLDREQYEALQSQHEEIVFILLKNLCSEFASRLRATTLMVSELER